MDSKSNSVIGVICVVAIISSTVATPTTVAAPPFSDNIVSDEREGAKEVFERCLHKKDVTKCLKKQVISVLDDVIQSEDPFSVSLYNLNFSLNKNPQFIETDSDVVDSTRSFVDILGQKLKTLIESRVIQVRLTDEAEKENIDLSLNVNEGRKKKGGGKHGGMMMGGMALMAFMAQIFMSKIAFMSGAALILAKIALLFSALTNLKKSSGSGHGDHVVYATAEKQGWQRSMHKIPPAILQQQSQLTEDLAYGGHPTMPAYSYDGV